MNIQIRVAGGSVKHVGILSHHVDEQILRVATAAGDTIFYSPGYWQAYVVDPKGVDPLDLHD